MASNLTPEDSGVEAYQQKMNEGAYAEARALIERQIAGGPVHEDLRDAYAEVLWRTGEPERAVQMYLEMAQAAVRQEAYTWAIGFLKKAHAIDPTHAATLALLTEISKQALGVALTPEALSRCSLFELLDETSFRVLGQAAVWRLYMPGQVILKAGTPSDRRLFVLLRGEAEVLYEDETGSVPVGHLQAGDIFGEVGFLTLRPRSATVVARSRTDVLEIPARAMDQILTQRPEVQSMLMQLYQVRLEKTLQAVKAVARRRRK
ncbi:MAG: cyclic nucleotide-binding domain-containing protein [Acidobacteria bacterium]|nr:cyclic nucleotide-binding domain-containing protein [Acidobacteriota bacterium]MDW7983096.1 cyclic nucleotide-binding domain-containing protein [Acidobacteriota bacterium]